MADVAGVPKSDRGPEKSPITRVPYKWSNLRHESEKGWGESRWTHAVGISAPDYKLLVKLSDFCHLIIAPKRRYKVIFIFLNTILILFLKTDDILVHNTKQI